MRLHVKAAKHGALAEVARLTMQALGHSGMRPNANSSLLKLIKSESEHGLFDGGTE